MADVERVWREAKDGVFRIEPLKFHLAGIPTYILLAELALGRTVRGELPVPDYPEALRETGRRTWWSRAEALFGHAEQGAATNAMVPQALLITGEAAICAAHSILAARGEWVTNEKRILAKAGLGDLDRVVLRVDDPVAMVRTVRERCEVALG